MERVLIVDDNPDIREVLGTYAAKEGFEPITAKDGFEALDLFRKTSPAVILLDVMMPGMDGYRVCERIRSESDVPIILITAKGEDYERVMGLDIGADDYIVKPFEPVELLARIEVVLRRAGKSEMHLRYGDIQVDIEKHTALKNGMPVALTPKEFDVLVFFMRNPDVAITREQLLSNIWGFDFTGESRSVDIHVQQVRRKMGLQGKLITITKLGYRLERR